MTTVALAAPGPAASRRSHTPVPDAAVAPAIAVAVALAGAVAGWRGTDLPAQLYRVTMFHRLGMALWDPQWFSGHWALAYSVLYPPVAATLGVTTVAALSAGGAALSFDRLVTARFGRSGRLGSVLFALGTGQQLAIGQLSFLMGEALALGACWAAARRRWALAAALAAGAALASPLAGAFCALAGAALVVVSLAGAAPARQRARSTAVLVGAAVPVVVVAVAFSDPGPFPFSFVDFAFDACVAVALYLLAPKSDRLLRSGAALYVAATVVCFVVPNPVGENVGRLAEVVALPVAACVLWPRRRALLAVLAVPMVLAVWAPAWGAITGRVSAMPSTHRSYYVPLVNFLSADGGPPGRVEVVPTRYHWEAAYVAPVVPIVRGWERQLDISRAPLFYKGRLDAARYRAWLRDNGARFVAVPDAPLDMAGRSEASLIAAGVPGLSPVWGNDHWRVFAIDGAPGIVSGPARLTAAHAGHVTLDVTAPGAITVHVADSGHWSVTHGAACAAASGGSVVVNAARPGRVVLAVGYKAQPCHLPSASS